MVEARPFAIAREQKLIGQPYDNRSPFREFQFKLEGADGEVASTLQFEGNFGIRGIAKYADAHRRLNIEGESPFQFTDDFKCFFKFRRRC